MREPVFTETMQISIVVRDMDATLKRFVDGYGIGPWEIYEFNPGTMTEMLGRGGEETEFRFKIAVTMVGSVQWELVQPLEDEGVFAEFLREHGEGLHHVAVGGKPYGETLAALEANGRQLLQGGVYNRVRFAYLTTNDDLGVVTEIFDWPEGHTQEPDAVYPPAPPGD
jgi:methylmalonyl-CoA/ethylmalonyl-CoA epimerase